METGETPALPLAQSLRGLERKFEGFGADRRVSEWKPIQLMKKLLLLFSLGSFLFLTAANAQYTGSNSHTLIFDSNTGLPIPPPSEPSLPRFDLSFSGGTPKDLVRAVEKETGQPLNVIIPEGRSEVKLPELHLKNVTMLELSDALKLSSQKQEAHGNGKSYFTYQTGYFFKTVPVPTTNSIWVFYQDLPAFPPEPARTCRFYQLAPYLESGYKVDDITTAVETGWKMLGNPNSANISYHKDTKLLIAVGDSDALALIDQVLTKLSLKSKDDPYAAATKSENAK